MSRKMSSPAASASTVATGRSSSVAERRCCAKMRHEVTRPKPPHGHVGLERNQHEPRSRPRANLRRHCRHPRRRLRHRRPAHCTVGPLRRSARRLHCRDHARGRPGRTQSDGLVERGHAHRRTLRAAIAGRAVPRQLPQRRAGRRVARPRHRPLADVRSRRPGGWFQCGRGIAHAPTRPGHRCAQSLPDRTPSLERRRHPRRRAPSPTSPRSPSCNTARSPKPTPSTISSTTPSRAGSSSSKPRAWSPNANSSRCPTRSTNSAPTPGPTTAVSTMSPRRSSEAPSTSAIQPLARSHATTPAVRSLDCEQQ